MRILSAESLRFPEQGSSSQGKSGPKPRPKGVGDGQQVEIPVPPYGRLSEGGTQEGRYRQRLDVLVQAGRGCGRQIRHTKPQAVMGREQSVPNGSIPNCQEKPLASPSVPVPQTDTGRRGENPQARERTPVKELGNSTP